MRAVALDLLAAQGPLEPGRFRAAVHFADPPVNLYQLRQWYEPMRRLARVHPVVLLVRHPESAVAALRESGLPVALVSRIGELELFLAEQPVRAMFYVNQNQRNFAALRFAEPAHVFVSHGESDKTYMSSNQLKAYDVTFVAGQAACDRVARRLVGFDPARLVPVGRPQIDVDPPWSPSLPQDGRTVVLYAPTWEGDRPSMAYGSVQTHGPDLVRALVATGEHRVVYRPHPRTGVHDPAAARASDAVVALLRRANAADPGAHHVVDDTPTLDWQLRVADVCVCDVSAVAFDWLSTAKPLVLTRPAAPDVDLTDSELADRVPMLDATRAGDAPAVLADAVAQAMDGSGAYTDLVAHHFGDVSPGASMARFLAAADRVVTEREAALAARRAR